LTYFFSKIGPYFSTSDLILHLFILADLDLLISSIWLGDLPDVISIDYGSKMATLSVIWYQIVVLKWNTLAADLLFPNLSFSYTQLWSTE